MSDLLKTAAAVFGIAAAGWIFHSAPAPAPVCECQMPPEPKPPTPPVPPTPNASTDPETVKAFQDWLNTRTFLIQQMFNSPRWDDAHAAAVKARATADAALDAVLVAKAKPLFDATTHERKADAVSLAEAARQSQSVLAGRLAP